MNTLSKKNKNIITKIKSFLLDIFFPSFCAGCKKEGWFLCENCKQKIELLKTPSHFPEKAKIKKFYCAAEYRQKILKELIHNFKYKKIAQIKNEIGELVVKYLESVNFESSKEQILVPVPLHKKRLSDRGFNQSELIAKELGKHFNIPVYNNIISRKKYTKHQTLEQKRKERKENLKDAFSTRPNISLKNKEVILVDDVITTGATLKECAKTLAKTNPKKITAIVVAK